MLKILRNKELKRKVIWVVAIVIIISFGFFGTAYLLAGYGQAGYAGRVFGKKISFQDFEKTLQDVRVQGLLRYGDKFQQMSQYMDFENEAWDRLILRHKAEKEKVKVSNDEVINTIRNYPIFQREGQFDSLLYNDVLKYALRMRPRDFEESVRDTLRFSKLYRDVTSGVTISEENVKKAFEEKNEKVQVSYALVSPDRFLNEAAFNEQEAQKYYEHHKIEFILPSTVNVEYIELPLPEDADDGEIEAVQEKANSVYQDLISMDVPDMDEAAQKHELEAKTSGFFSADNPKLELGWSFDLLNTIFELPVDQIHGPVTSSSGVQIVKVIEKKESYLPEYDEVKGKVKDTVLHNAAKEITKTKAEEYLEGIKSQLENSPAADFVQVVKDMGLDIHQTPAFTRGQYLPKVGISRNFQEAAFALVDSDKALSDAVEVTNGFAILHLDDHVPADQSQWEEQQNEIRQALLNQKRNTVFNEYMSKLRMEANLQSNLDQARR